MKKPNHTDFDLLDCAQCDSSPVIITERQRPNLWKGHIKCNSPQCGMRTPSKTDVNRCVEIWNREPDDDAKKD